VLRGGMEAMVRYREEGGVAPAILKGTSAVREERGEGGPALITTRQAGKGGQRAVGSVQCGRDGVVVADRQALAIARGGAGRGGQLMMGGP
jgi:hypothetical protein